MEFNSSGQIKTFDQIRIDRERKGYCKSCRVDPVRCFEIRKGIFGIIKKEPLTISGQVDNGICLHCHPHMAPGYARYSQGEEEFGDSAQRNNFARMNGSRGSQFDRPQNVARRSELEDNGEEIVTERTTNIMGETFTLLKSKTKKKKKEQIIRFQQTHNMSDLDNHGMKNQQSRIHKSTSHKTSDRFLNRSSSYCERKFEEQDDDEMDELERMVAQHFANTSEVPKFHPQSFVAGAELPIYDMEDDPSVLTMPTVFADEGSVIPRSTQSIYTSAIQTEKVDRNIPKHKVAATHELHDPLVPKRYEPNFESEIESSPDIDNMKDVVRDCMQMNSDEQAIEIMSQALMSTDYFDLTMFCLSTLWVLVRKSDENKRHVLHGSKNEETRDDETPFGAIISAMVKFDSVEVQTVSCGIIWSLSMNPDDRKDVAQLGGCQAILQAMLVHTDNESLQVMALGALKVLSFNVVGQSSLRQISASAVVAASMLKHITNPTIQADGCVIICNLATGPNHFIIPVTDDEIEAIVKSMISHQESASIQEGAIYALMELSSSIVNVEMMRQNTNLYDALDVSFSKYPKLVERDIQILLENLEAVKPGSIPRISSS